jgi:8-oxo-dGTP pyrophosphatase MutT (NUDIX family)
MDGSAAGTQLVIACVVERDGRYLVCRRPDHKRHGGLWEFPGGKLLDGENDLAAARRELAEELGLSVESIGGLLYERQDPGSNFVIRFVVTVASGEPDLREHTAVAWLAPADMVHCTLAPSDRAFVDASLVRTPTASN